MKDEIKLLNEELKNIIENYFKKINFDAKRVSVGYGIGGTAGGYYRVYRVSWTYNKIRYEIGLDSYLRIGGYGGYKEGFNNEKEFNTLCDILKDFYVKHIDILHLYKWEVTNK